MGQFHPTDSDQIDKLRLAYKRTRPMGSNATAFRLGKYAGEHGIAITDFGAHSTRWISQFIAGFDFARERAAIIQDLT